MTPPPTSNEIIPSFPRPPLPWPLLNYRLYIRTIRRDTRAAASMKSTGRTRCRVVQGVLCQVCRVVQGVLGLSWVWIGGECRARLCKCSAVYMYPGEIGSHYRPLPPFFGFLAALPPPPLPLERLAPLLPAPAAAAEPSASAAAASSAASAFCALSSKSTEF